MWAGRARCRSAELKGRLPKKGVLSGARRIALSPTPDDYMNIARSRFCPHMPPINTWPPAPEPLSAEELAAATATALLDDGRPTQAPHPRPAARRHTDPAAERAVAAHSLPAAARAQARRWWQRRPSWRSACASSTGSGSSASIRRRLCRARRSSACSPRWSMAHGPCNTPWSKAESGEWPRRHEAPSGRWRRDELRARWRSPSRARWRSLTCGSKAAHPDANARNLRDMWLPAIEWLYSERVGQLTMESAGSESIAPRTPDGTKRLSDEAILAAADFGLFVDLCSMCQTLALRDKNDRRTEVEELPLSPRAQQPGRDLRAQGPDEPALDARAQGCQGGLAATTAELGRASSGRRASSSSRTPSASTSASSPLRRRMRRVHRGLLQRWVEGADRRGPPFVASTSR